MKRLTEKQVLRAIENIAENYYEDTKEDWWLKLAVYVEKRIAKNEN